MPETDGAAVLVCVGTSHRVAPIPFIERALAGAERYRDAWQAAVRDSASQYRAVRELVVLSTCNRVEVWAAVTAQCAARTIDDIVAALGHCDADRPDVDERRSDDAGAPPVDGARLYAFRDRHALRHLCRVAAGLDSMVVGEPQIAGQVVRAFNSVLYANGGAPLLGHAARTARLASRRARSETAIGRGPASISTVAVHMAAERVGGLDGTHVLVVGAGAIGGLTCQVLRGSGATLTVVNRTLSRAESLAERVGARALSLDSLADAVADADVVIVSTASPRTIIDATMLRPALAARTTARPLTLIDVAVPRNVAGDAAQLAGVTVLDIDDLRQRVRQHLAERCREIPRAESIIDDVLQAIRD